MNINLGAFTITWRGLFAGFFACLFWILCGATRVDAQPFAYISNSGSNSVSVIDLATNTINATIPVGQLPFGVAANSAGTRVYVSNNGSNTISVIDTATNTVVKTIAVGTRPRGVAVHPNGSRIYVANSNSNTLSVIDAATNTVTATVPVIAAFDVVVHPTNARVYVASAQSIAVIDTNTNTLITTISIDGCPFGLALNPAGSSLYVARGCIRGIPTISTTGNNVISTIPTLDGRFAVGVSPSSSRVYVTNDGNANPNIMVIDGGTNTLITTVEIPGGSANGVSVHPDGTRFYVADEAQNVLHVFDAASNTKITSIPVGSRPIAFGQFIGPGPRTCQVDLPETFSQKDPRWGDETYDNANCSTTPRHCKIRQVGCALTSLAMALKAAGINTNPLQLNNDLKQFSNAFDQQSNLNFYNAAGDIARLYTKNLRYREFISTRTEDLEEALCRSFPVIVGVNLRPTITGGRLTASHFVVVTGKQGDEFLIADPAQHPGDTTRRTLSFYNNVFQTRGYVEDPLDLSAITLSVGDNAELLVTDASGRRAGFDFSFTEDLKEIPNSAYSRDNLENDETGELGIGVSHFLNISEPQQGFYRIKVCGIKTGIYKLVFSGFSQDGVPQQPTVLSGIAKSGSTSFFDLQFVLSPGSVPRLVRIATFQSILEDIRNGKDLNLITNQGIANSLSSKIEAAEAATLRGQVNTSRNILTAFKNELTAQAGNHIDILAVQILREDADSLLSQLPQ